MNRWCAVVGKGRNCDPALVDLAVEVGRRVARSAWHTVTGGVGGVMAGGLRGAWEEGGVGLGLRPLLPPEVEIPELPEHTLIVETGLPPVFRNALLGSMADAMLVLPGSHGTVQEAMVALEFETPTVAVGDHRGYATAALGLVTVRLDNIGPWLGTLGDLS